MDLKVHRTFKEIRTNGAAAGASFYLHFYDIIFLMKHSVTVRKRYSKAVLYQFSMNYDGILVYVMAS